MMAPKRHEPRPFPVDIFVQQYSTACHMNIDASQVQTRPLRSKKHATAEVSLPKNISGDEKPTQEVVIAKYYESREHALLDHERAVLSHGTSTNIPVPRILRALDNFLVLERVEGRTLMDLINDDMITIGVKQDVIGKLGAWLSAFHVAFARYPKARCRGDANLRNFIVTSACGIVGVDFEEASMSDPTRDLHEAVDSILQSDPGIFTEGNPSIEWKYDLCEWLLRSYANAARLAPATLFKDAARFVDAQLAMMRDLAGVRGTLNRITPLIPAIKEALEIVMKRLIKDT
jgi:aminoglycoside phosphotransferase